MRDAIRILDRSDKEVMYVGLTLFSHLNVDDEYDVVRVQNARDSNARWLAAAWRFCPPRHICRRARAHANRSRTGMS